MHRSDNSFKDYVLEQLGRIQDLRCQAMFGGYGLYASDLFFAIIHGGKIYFLTSNSDRARFESNGHDLLPNHDGENPSQLYGGSSRCSGYLRQNRPMGIAIRENREIQKRLRAFPPP